MISQKSVAEVIDISQVEDVIEDFVSLKKRGVNMIGLCPFHNEKTPSFTVSPVKNLYKCFGCGQGGNAVSFIMEHENYSFPEAIRYLANKYNIKIEETQRTDEEKEQIQEKESLFIINQFASDHFNEQLLDTDEGKSVGLSYFKNRGLLLNTITEFKLGYSPSDRKSLIEKALSKGYKEEYLETLGLKSKNGFDFFRNRIIFPISNLSGKVIAFGGRTLSSDKKIPKYLNSPESVIYNKSNSLYGIYQAKNQIRRENNCYLVEGYTDVLNLHQNEIKNVVASSGTSLTEGQLRVIKRFSSVLTFLYDGDSAGQKAALRGLPLALDQEFDVKIVPLPPDQDPDSMIKEIGSSSFQEYLTKNTEDFLVFWAQNIKKEFSENPLEKSNSIKELLTVLAHVKEALKRSIYVKEICRILDIDEGSAIGELNKNLRKLISKEQRENYRNNASPPPSNVPGPFVEEEFISEIKSAPKQSNYKKTDYHQEKDIIRILLIDGHKFLKEEEKYTVADFIIDNLKDVITTFEDVNFKLIIDEFTLGKKADKLPDLNFFINHSNGDIRTVAVDFAQEPYTYAKWSDNGVELQTQKSYAENYERDSRQAVLRFKLKKLGIQSTEILQRMKDKNISESDQKLLLLTYHKIVDHRKSLADQLGAIVL